MTGSVLPAYLGFMFGHPGKKLLFMGAELGAYQEWSPAESLDWSLLEQGIFHKGVQQLVMDLNRVYRNHPALYQQDYDCHGFNWLILDDHDQPVVVISNMTPHARHNYRIGVPQAGNWHEILNTDNGCYGSGNIVNGTIATSLIGLHGHQQSLELTLPPLATIMLTISR